MKRDVSPVAAAAPPHTPPHAGSCTYLMAGLTELTFADELSVQTQFDSFPQKACKQQNNTRERAARCSGDSDAWGFLKSQKVIQMEESFSLRGKRPSPQIKKEKLEV